MALPHIGAAAEAKGTPGQVTVLNKSYATTCAEEDNIDLELTGDKVASFTMRASQPIYIDRISTQQSKPDFRGCSFGHDDNPRAAKPAPPQKVMLYRSPNLWLVGLRFANFWRSNDVPVIVGDRRETGLELIQLWVKSGRHGEEVVAFYPRDGYWRLRALPYGEKRLGAYGSSVLVGPIEHDGKRPYVAIKRVIFDPATRSFRLDFVQGGSATLKLVAVDQQECLVSVAFSGGFRGNQPFAAVRSMFVSERNSDAAEVAWAAGEPAENILSFRGGKVSRLWIGRSTLSIHNNSAPDLLLSGFALSR